MSELRWLDVSVPLTTGMDIWPGDPAFAISPVLEIARGNACNLSSISMGTHTGTHVDAPFHFEPDGKRLDELDSSRFFGDALLIDLSSVDAIHSSDLDGISLPPRVLLKTRNGLTGRSAADYVALMPDAAQYLVDAGVRMVGIDGPSIGRPDESGAEVHHILLRNEVLVIESLDLRAIAAGPCTFVALPLSIARADGAPCRAFVGLEGVDG